MPLSTRRLCLRLLALLALGLSASAAALSWGAAWLHLPAEAPPTRADALVVLGGDSDARILEAARLYNAGITEQVWITGDVPPPGSQVSLAEAWRLIGRRNGIPEEQVTLIASRTTWEDGAQLAVLVRERETRSLVIISSWYHLRRVRCMMARHLDAQHVRLTLIAAPGLPHTAERWWRLPSGWAVVARELAAHGYYWQRYGLTPWQC